MSVSHCMHHALAIALKPLDRWADEISLLPDTCQQDCSAPRSCRERNAEYLRVQYKAQKRLAERAAAKAQLQGSLL